MPAHRDTRSDKPRRRVSCNVGRTLFVIFSMPAHRDTRSDIPRRRVSCDLFQYYVSCFVCSLPFSSFASASFSISRRFLLSLAGSAWRFLELWMLNEASVFSVISHATSAACMTCLVWTLALVPVAMTRVELVAKTRPHFFDGRLPRIPALALRTLAGALCSAVVSQRMVASTCMLV